MNYQTMRFLLVAALSWVLINNVPCQNMSYTPKALSPLNSVDSAAISRECKERRELLASSLKGGVLIMNNNEGTGENFFYLTGWSGKPSSCYIELGDTVQPHLFIPFNTPKSLIWNGYQAEKKEAKALGTVPFAISEFKKQLKSLIDRNKKIYILRYDKEIKSLIKEMLSNTADTSKIMYADSVLNSLREIKSTFEIQSLKKAMAVTGMAITNAYLHTKPDIYEYEIDALFKYEYTRNGLKEGFTSIIGSGMNSTSLHYEANNRLMKSGDVLLMDVGASCNGYLADITRTVPVNGKFTPEQLTLYNIVLKAQQEGIKVMKPGRKISEFNSVCSKIIIHELYKLGFITDTTKSWQKGIFLLYFAGHNIGLNVHDIGVRKEFVPGMVYTIEPGIYINPQMLDFIYETYAFSVSRSELDAYVKKVTPIFQKYAGIGIRIEDDILITSNGNEVLTAEVPKLPHDIEKLMQKKR